ncbi:MAG: hypothetical protein QJT81_07560 [Candidatus Thiothrix putei]|uniref:Uncharacterized protein n=1 Tax=Candidatus Thiothrix putei TaxID=3080811 RepID=A0AA95HE87_9GAMM|nr:MAG: hypothetical protein QJT81_07560 [Candidatus Thiothrix putei]
MKLYLHLTGVLMLSLLAVACGGGGSTNDTNSNNSGSTGILPTNRVGYAIDDYVVDVTVHGTAPLKRQEIQ